MDDDFRRRTATPATLMNDGRRKDDDFPNGAPTAPFPPPLPPFDRPSGGRSAEPSAPNGYFYDGARARGLRDRAPGRTCGSEAVLGLRVELPDAVEPRGRDAPVVHLDDIQALLDVVREN